MKFSTWPLEVRIVAIAWVPAVLAAITLTFLLKDGSIHLADDVYAVSMQMGLGLTALLVIEFVTWVAHGVGFFEACLRSSFSGHFRAKMRSDLRRPQAMFAHAGYFAFCFVTWMGLSALL